MTMKLGGNIGGAVVYHARSARSYSAGIKCRHCRNQMFARIEEDEEATGAVSETLRVIFCQLS